MLQVHAARKLAAECTTLFCCEGVSAQLSHRTTLNLVADRTVVSTRHAMQRTRGMPDRDRVAVPRSCCTAASP